MSYLHKSTDPRHARMFELLRQTEQAAQTKIRVDFSATKKLDEQTAQRFKETAVNSLRFQN